MSIPHLLSPKEEPDKGVDFYIRFLFIVKLSNYLQPSLDAALCCFMHVTLSVYIPLSYPAGKRMNRNFWRICDKQFKAAFGQLEEVNQFLMSAN